MVLLIIKSVDFLVGRNGGVGGWWVNPSSIIHNNITPSNIMFEEDGTPVINDLGSCRKVGASLHGTQRTHGWHDPRVQTALEKNDLDAFTELQTWLIGSSADNFLFKRG